MKNKFISEIFLTEKFVSEEAWLNFIFEISKLNGKFKTWDIFVLIELNTVRFFIQTSKKIPPVISNLNDFLLKTIEPKEKINKYLKLFYFVKNDEKNVLDIYDKNETKKSRKLKISKIAIFPYCRNNFLSKTDLFFENKNKKIIKKQALLNIPQQFLSIDFSIYSRFFYKKDAIKFLDIQKSLHVLKSDEKNSILKVNGFPYLNDNYYLHLSNYDFAKHSLIVGASGCGKSKFMSSLISNLKNNSNTNLKYKVVVIDPHAALEQDIGGLDETEVVDFKKPQNSVNLFMNSGKDVVISTELLLTLFQSLIGDLYNSKLERVLRHSVYTLLVKKELSFANLRLLILEPEYRNELIKALENELPESTVDFFFSDFNELKNQSYQEAIAPIISFIDEMQMLPVFNQNFTNLKGIKEVISNHFLTIFSLDQVALGVTVAKTIAGFIMQQMLQLVQASAFDEHIIFLIDEVAVVENPILCRFLSEARKYNLSLILAGQYFNQVSEGLQKAIFANVINYYIFRVSRSDAQLLESNIQMEVAVRNSYKLRMEILTELANRECILRLSQKGKVLSAFKGKTVDFTPFPKSNKNQILGTDLIGNVQNLSIKIKKVQNFSINSKIALKTLMKSQSTGRKKVNSGEG